MNGERREERAAQQEASHAGNFWIEPHGCEYVPGGHGPAIIITGQAIGPGAEKLGLDAANDFLRSIGSTSSIEFPGHFELRLVTHEGIRTAWPGIQLLEEAVEAIERPVVAAHPGEQAI